MITFSPVGDCEGLIVDRQSGWHSLFSSEGSGCEAGRLTISVEVDQFVSKAVFIGGGVEGWACDKTALTSALHHNASSFGTEPTCITGRHA